MKVTKSIRAFVRNEFPPITHQLFRRVQRVFAIPPVGYVDYGALRRLAPVSTAFGYDRGIPIDRYYLERFLESHASAIQGRVLEIGDNTYTCRFGGIRVTQSDILFPLEGNPHATIIADLTNADHIQSNIFDCIICTQTLAFIYETRSAIRTLHRILKPGGVLLLTAAGISQVSPLDMEKWGDYWRFTTLSLRSLLEESFPAENINVESYGNVLAACAFLYGLAAADLTPEELDYHDANYQLVTVAKVAKGLSSNE